MSPISARKDRPALDRLLDPDSIAFVGGTRAMNAWRVCRAKGFAGDTFMVNPRLHAVDGVATYASVADLPQAPDATYVALDPAKTIDTVRTLADRGAGGVVAFGSGFSETGPDGAALEQALIAAADRVPLVGPNCFGIINYVTHGSLWPIDYPQQDRNPAVAIISQSGNVAINICQNRRSVPLSHVVSLGNQAGVQVHDLIRHFTRQKGIRAIGVYLEGLRDVPRFHDACIDALSRGVAVVVLKAGRSDISAEIAMSHTNSLAGSRAMYDALFDRTGVSAVHTIPEMLETLRLFVTWETVPSHRVAFFSCSGGESGMAADFADAAGLTMVPPDAAQTGALRALLPPFGPISNPVDMTTTFYGKGPELAQVVDVLMRGSSDTGVLVMDFALDELHPDSPPAKMVDGFAGACAAAGKRAAVASMKPEAIPPAIQGKLLDAGVLPLQGLDVGCRAIAAAARTHARRHRFRTTTPSPLLTGIRAVDPVVLDEWRSKQLLATFGVPVPHGRRVRVDDVGTAMAAFSGPVAVKACSAALPHKTEAGAVVLNVTGAAAATDAVRHIQAAVRSYDPSIAIDHVLIEDMVVGAVAELIIGIKSDPQFGLSLVVGSGGIFVELLHDAAPLLLPTDRESVARAVRGLAGAPLFSGFRGRPPGDVDAVVDAAFALARFATAHANRLLEADINPLFVLPDGKGVVAGDALIRWNTGAATV